MKCVLMLCGLLALTAAETYSTENDDFDIEGLLNNKDLYRAYIECFLDINPCDEVQADFKKDLPEAVRESCAKCTDAQKHIFNRFLSGSKERYPEDYNAVRNKYDPDGKHFATLEAAIANA